MNILLINWRDMQHPQAGGAEVHYHEIFRRIVARGHTVYLLTTRFPGSAVVDEQDGICLYRWGQTFLFNWQVPFFIRKLLTMHRIDCIVDDVNKIPFFTPRLFPRIPCGVLFHHLFGKTIFETTTYILAQYIMFLENRITWGYASSPCCTVSKSTSAELVARGFVPSNITIIENSVDTERYLHAQEVPKEHDLLLYVGRLKRYKNVDIVMAAMKLLNTRNIRLRFCICGSGDDEARLRECAKTMGVESQVTFTGYVDEETKIGLYRRAALLVNPSIKEGWGITNVEANASGTAVVANDAPGLSESIQNNVTGLLYKFNDVNDLADCIQKLLTDETLRVRMEKAGQEWVKRFSWDASSLRMEDWLVKTVIGAKAS
jgi:glycosyltransferase involved in cell wall biosynthesis